TGERGAHEASPVRADAPESIARSPDKVDALAARAETSHPGGSRALAPDVDALAVIAPPTCFRRLVGAEVPAGGGRVDCPRAGCEDAHGSCLVGATSAEGWRCTRCGEGGGVYELARARGDRHSSLIELRRRLRRELAEDLP